MRISKICFLMAIGTLVFVGAGCSLGGSSTKPAAVGDGGIYKSINRGDNWAQKVAVLSASNRLSLNEASLISLVQDPQDPNTLYAGTAENGLLYSVDAGESWAQTRDIPRGRVNAIAVDPKDKCVVYVAVDNKLLKTIDCARTFSAAYVDSRNDKQVTSVAVDFFNPQIVWLTSMAGDVLKSVDNGASWSNARTFRDSALKIVIHPTDSRKLYVALKRSGIWRTDDQGLTWKDLSTGYVKLDGAKEFADLSTTPASPNYLVFASKYGLVASDDTGDSWKPVPLLTAPGTTPLLAVSIDSKDAQKIYFSTTTTFYKSDDAGVTWTTKKLPTSRGVSVIVVDKSNSNTLYLGVAKIKK